jgi:hypothetical protein
VPKKLKLSGKQETFTAAVTFETLDLFGKVEGSQKVVLVAK